MSNGTAPIETASAPSREAGTVSVTFDLAALSYGDMRRLRTMQEGTTAAQDVLDDVLAKVVVGGLDAIPLKETRAVILALMAQINEEMSPKNPQAAPS